MSNAGRQLTERGHLLGVDQPGLHGLQLTQGRFRLVARFAGFCDQAGVLYRDDSLIGEGAHQLDLLLRKRFDRVRKRQRTPIGLPSRKSGTPNAEWKSPMLAESFQVYSISVSTSKMWTTLPSNAVRPGEGTPTSDNRGTHQQTMVFLRIPGRSDHSIDSVRAEQIEAAFVRS